MNYASAGRFRLIRLPISPERVNEIDDLVARGIGGFRSRDEFLREAIDAYVAELKYGPSTDTGVEPPPRVFNDSALPASSTQEVSSFSAESALVVDRDGAITIEGVAEVENAPLFGLHNRDYPSLWAAAAIAKLTRNGPIPYERCVDAVTRQAWDLGALLKRTERSNPLKASVMFPTNRHKPESAESAFRLFAIGSYSHKEGIKANGALFLWRVCQIASNGEFSIGMTDIGYSLLENLRGLSPTLPHSPKHTAPFLEHLRTYASEDHWGFATVVRLASARATRDEIISDFRHRKPSWTEAQAASYAAGYISRSREWGLIDPKQHEGRYAATELGVMLADV